MIECSYPLTRISTPGEWSVHTYFRFCPESPDGERVLFYTIADDLQSGQVMLADRDGTHPRPLGARHDHPQTRPTFHTAARQRWTPDGRPMFLRNGRMEIYASEDGPPDILTPGGSLDPSGQWVLGGRQPESDNMPWRTADELCSVHRAKVGTGETEVLFTEEDVWAQYPGADIARRYRMVFKQTQWFPDGDRIFAVYTNEEGVGKKPPGFEYLKSLVVADADGKNLRYLGEIGHHPNATPDGHGVLCYDDARSILCEGREQDGQDLIYFDVDTGERRAIQKRAEGTHASFSPDGRMIVTDMLVGGIFLVDPETGDMREIVAFDQPTFDGPDKKCHPHPAWSRDGRRIYFNCAESGVGQVVAVDLPETTR